MKKEFLVQFVLAVIMAVNATAMPVIAVSKESPVGIILCTVVIALITYLVMYCAYLQYKEA